MAPWVRIQRLLIVGMTVVLTATVLANNHQQGANPMLATSDKPAQWCATYNGETLRALKRGDKRVVVVVTAFQPATPETTNLVVTLLTADKTRRHELTQFGVHPLRAFTAADAGQQQRFLVSLASQAAWLEENQPLCLEIGFNTSQGESHSGTAELAIELVDVPR